MNRPPAATLALATMGMLAAGGALAGRPLSTEDASVLEAKACQVEAWIDRSREATDFWTVPACNFGANIEWQFGGARTRQGGSAALSQALFQAKTVLRSVEDNPWGVGLVAGVNRSPRRETRKGWSDPYVIAPVSFKLGSTENLLHLNAGWLRDRAERRHLTLWGVAIEAPAGETLTILGEAFGENADRPFLRFGGRYSAVKDRLDFDLTVVTRSGGTRAERLVSLGLYYKTDAFLP